MKLSHFVRCSAIPVLVHSLAPTDEPRDADPPQSGYLPNHNISPALLSSYTKKWTMKYNTAEEFYANPLVYTAPNTTKELVILASIQNIVRILDSTTGALIISRTLDAPYVSSDSNCNDGATVGITGTPIIDTTSNIMYLFTKGYCNGLPGPQGVINGAYKFWALNVPSLTIVPGYPVLIKGPASNDPQRYFIGGTILQRPGLAMMQIKWLVGDSVIAGFGGHCDSMNYTDILIAVSKTPSKGVTDMMEMEVSPGEPADPNLLLGKGGKAGIWQSGMGIAADTVNNRVFFSTGWPRCQQRSYRSPAPGKAGTSTLDQAIVNIGVDPVTGLLKQQDYFSPINYEKLNAGDKDLSSSGVTLLDPITFSGGGVNRVGVAGSKAGVIYVVNADNLGGFKMGPNSSDAGKLSDFEKKGFRLTSSVLQELTFAGFCTTCGALQAWKKVLNAQGQPNFAFAAESNIPLGCHNTPTVTSLNGVAGTAIVWLADTSKGLVAFHAVPNGSVLTQITLPGSGGLQKFHRPIFGNNHVYVTSSNKLIAIGGVAQ
ncbi:uncharacterized protein LY89DRAFT_670394 [Mollisia scopiformis]|uniref:Uncharacterized protein n=1 Tax=Mollisia scopiformis TaxID=149040 RepID=A0A194X6P9_MOLSC|nr:uncharacterized protein LY89DRAFT_670394 [Mollisia scopiformis]KUJ15855.1 hypothetical protein LY89DRAFT_670394 [Mollisia scopiformis]